MSTTTADDEAAAESSEDTEVDEFEIDVGGPDAVELEFGPTKLSSGIAVGAAVLAALSSGLYSGLALPFSFAGVGFVAVAVYRAESRRWLSLGVMSLFIGIIASDMFGPPGLDPAVYLASMTATIVSWDVGQHAITIGEQFGLTAPTRRGELVHAAGSVIVGVLASGIAYGVYFFGSGNQPTLAVALLMLGAVLLIWALRD
ncbi:MAG: hypothetical protein ABEJ42_07760 [Halobacteriaceae archaeon]